jgi:hypothetical protein
MGVEEVANEAAVSFFIGTGAALEELLHPENKAGSDASAPALSADCRNLRRVGRKWTRAPWIRDVLALANAKNRDFNGNRPVSLYANRHAKARD